MLLVDDDQRRVRGTGAKTAERAPTTILASPLRDPLALVAPLGVAQARVEDRDAIAEAGAHAARATAGASAISGTSRIVPSPRSSAACASLEVDLGLARAGRAVEQERSALPRCERRRRSARPAARCSLRRARRLVLAGERLALGRRRARSPRRRGTPGRNERERARRASTRSSRRARARGRRAPAGPLRRRRRPARPRPRPGGRSSSATTIPRARRRPNCIVTIAPLADLLADLVAEGPRDRARRQRAGTPTRRAPGQPSGAPVRPPRRARRAAAARRACAPSRYIALRPRATLKTTIAMFMPTLKASKQRGGDRLGRGTGTRSGPAWCPRRPASPGRASRASRPPARAARCGSLA